MVRKDDQTMSIVPRPSGLDTHPTNEDAELRASFITEKRIKECTSKGNSTQHDSGRQNDSGLRYSIEQILIYHSESVLKEK